MEIFTKKEIKNSFLRLLMILVSFFIGWFISVGPTVLYLNTKSFFANTGNHPIIFNDKTYIYKEPIQKAEMIVDYYQKGLFAYTFTPANNGSHFFYPSATLMFPLNWFFWIGMGIILVNRKNRFNNVVLAVVLLFTLFSQVLVNGIGATHRLQGIVPFLNIIAFIGLWSFSKKIIKDPILRNKLIIIFTAIFYLSQIYFFWIKNRGYLLRKRES